MRRFIDTVVLLAIGAVMVQAWLLHGWLFPDVVANSSMAPTLRGPHRLVVCRDCGLRFSCDSLELPSDAVAICPNCGSVDDALESLPGRPGDRLIIDRATWGWHAPSRWDMAVLRDPADPGALLVKRVIGLPGETVEIRAGDVYVDGKLARKSLAQFRRMAILVHDDDHRVRAGDTGTLSRWQPENRQTLWQLAEPGWTRAAGIAGAGEFSKTRLTEPDWLVYRHWQSPALHGGRPEPGPVLDDYAYNVQESRQLHSVSDLLLRCRIQAVGEGELWLRIGDGIDDEGRRPLLRLGLGTGQGELMGHIWDDVSTRHGFTFDPQRLAKGAVLELALVEGRVLLALDGNVVFEHVFDPPWQPLSASDRPLAVGATGAAVVLSGLEVLRDVYYTPVAGSRRPEDPCYRLGPGEYFVLGDNSPVSLDSRNWRPAGVPGELLIGRVLKVLAADRGAN